jgi:hypothetical protein
LHHIDLLLPLPLLTLYLTSYWIPIILLFTLQESLTCNKIFSGKESTWIVLPLIIRIYFNSKPTVWNKVVELYKSTQNFA